MKSVALHNLGCKVNSYELEVIGQNLQEMGYNLVPFDAKADIYIVNTCTVTNIADRKSRQMLHRARKMNPDAVVVAMGCYVQTGQEKLLEDEGVDLVIGNNRKKELPGLLKEYLEKRELTGKKSRAVSITDIGQTDEYEELELKSTAEHTRAYIKIQDGCNQFCSYCAIPYARGRVRSRKPEAVLAEVRRLADAGYQEIVLTGIHISSYGMDFVSRERMDYLEEEETEAAPLKRTPGALDVRGIAHQKGYLLELIRRIHQVEGVKRIRLGSLEPRIITENFVKALTELPKVCPHFHLSLQSGCDSVLKRMNRHYTAGEYYGKVELLRQYYDGPAITTDVIVGFPGETEEEFEQTMKFLEKTGFFEMHIFKYSRRKGTAADRMEGQLPEAVKTARSAKLLELEKRQSEAYRSGLLGKEITVLVEEGKEIEGKSYQIGHTPAYVKAAFASEQDRSNRFFTGIATAFLTHDILLMEKR